MPENEDEVKKNIEKQGDKLEEALKRVGLSMNRMKTQFIVCMNYQQRKPSRQNPRNREYEKPLEVEVGQALVKEKDNLKTFGVIFDNSLVFRSHWEETKKKLGGEYMQ